MKIMLIMIFACFLVQASDADLLENLLNPAPAGSTVILEGTYELDRTVIMDTQVTVVGNNATIRRAPNVVSNLVEVRASGVIFDGGILFDGGTGSYNGSGLVILGDHVLVDRLSFTQFQNAIVLNRADGCDVTRNHISKVKDGILGTACRSLLIADNQLEDIGSLTIPYGTGITVGSASGTRDGEGIVIRNNTLTAGTGTGITLLNTDNSFVTRQVLVENNTVINFNGSGIQASNNIEQLEIRGNQVAGCTTGISALHAWGVTTGLKAVTIEDNDVVSCPTGIQVNGNNSGLWIDDVMLRANHVTGSGEHGLFARQTNNLQVAANLLADNGDGIHIQYSANPVVKNNTLFDNFGNPNANYGIALLWIDSFPVVTDNKLFNAQFESGTTGIKVHNLGTTGLVRGNLVTNYQILIDSNI